MSKAKVTDVTGRQREAQIKENAEALAQRAGEMSMATANAAAKLETEILDLTSPNTVATVIDEVETVGVSLADDTQVIRVAEDLDFVTIGGNHYSFKAGQKYKVSKQVAQHLQEKGYLYDRL